MIMADYPKHDMNKLFDIIDEGVKSFWVDSEAVEEAGFLNKLFASLPAEAVEYGMRFLHGSTELPDNMKELLPLYIRLRNLIDYLEEAELMNSPMTDTSSTELEKRQKASEDMDKRRESFLMPVLGIKCNFEKVDDKDNNSTESEEGSGLHLMNAAAPVFICSNPLKTAAFYEEKVGFRAAHLDDEAMPHILLSRDNIHIALTEGELKPLHLLTNVPYDLYIYASEPLLLLNELSAGGVKIISQLDSSDESDRKGLNREFVFEDCDGRYICVSQKNL